MMDDFQIKQVESDDPEKVAYLIKLPAGFCDPAFLDYLERRILESFVIEAEKFLQKESDILLKGVSDGRN